MPGLWVPHTKMIYIANPNNPTGTYVSRAEFQAFMERVPEDVLVVMDEAYFEFAREVEDYPHALDAAHPNVLVLRTFSKAYGLAGFRVGYAMGPDRIVSQMMKTKLTFEPTAPAQAAARAALGDEEFLARSVEMARESRERLYAFFEEEGVRYLPSISNSVQILLDDARQAEALTQAMLEEGVILRRTGAFGLPEGIRITVGTPEEMDHLEKSFRKVSQSLEIRP
ncbi:MAG: aminotransferase class I/II-fold pyridoxal phosphate-dependent enzyme [Balneolaceae bacterium]|nr:aminotransferase class I/II-fold pyridoxal phosphate-dependent enzyme [Balneolaceae bacterium]